jgi:T5SS/PEP-CTERM-associated repeat protein/autotransporter-associated beta strand protein
MVISNEARVAGYAGTIGYNRDASNNSVLVTGTNSLWTNRYIYVGNYGSDNSLVISNGAHVVDREGYIGVNGLDYGNGNGNTVTVTGSNSLWGNSSGLYLGYGYGTNNSLVISNGGTVSTYDTYLGYESYVVGNNRVLVTGTNSSLNSSGSLYIGYYEDGDSITVRDGAMLYNSDGAYIGYGGGPGSGGNSNTLTVTGIGSLYSNGSSLTMGASGLGNLLLVSNGASAIVRDSLYIGNSGYSDAGSNNVIVTGGSSSLSVGSDIYIGYGESDDTLMISGGALVSAATTYLGGDVSYAGSSNSLLVTGGGSVLTNSGSLYVGYNGESNSLTVANGGAVYASAITIANDSGSTAALNIGSRNGSDTAGTIISPSIAFGSGTGTINFNQINTARLTSSISGLGTVQQLGGGTTILSGNNTYTGVTTISRGTLQAGSTNALGGSDVTLGGSGSAATLALSTNLTISSLI